MEVNMIKKFENQLRMKLSQKGTAHQGDEAQLFKAFKYFDLNDSGQVEKDEFKKALEKIGVWLESKDQLDFLFSYYDVDRSGCLDYEEFSSVLYNRKANAMNQKSQQYATDKQGIVGTINAKKETNTVLEKLRSKLNDRNNKSILGIARQFKIVDDDNSQKLEYNEFVKAMRDYQVGLNESECKQLFGYFDKDRNGYIDYDEFIVVLRGPMNNFRTAIVEKVFHKIDINRNGVLDVDDIMELYNVEKHPDYKSGKKTRQSIMRDFMKTFEQYSDIRNIPDGVVTLPEFKDYYTFVSASIDSDQYFDVMMTNCWKLDDQYAKNKARQQNGNRMTSLISDGQNKHKTPFATDGSSYKRNQPPREAEQLLERLRSKLKSRGTSSIFKLGKMFRIVDDNNSHTLCLSEFKKCMTEYRLGMSDDEIERLYKLFDIDNNESVSYDEFLRGVVGTMNQQRQQIVQRAFQKLDADLSGNITLSDVKRFYDAKNHPDVRAGKKTEDEILEQFLDTFEIHYSNLNGEKQRNKDVSLDEFMEYYNNISCNIDNDEYFSLMIRNAWKLDTPQKFRK